MSSLGQILASDAAHEWRYPAAFTWRTLVVALVALLLLVRTGSDLEIDRAAAMSVEGIGAGVGLVKESQVARGFGAVLDRMFPPQISEEVEIDRIDGFDRTHLPLFSHLETRAVTVQTLDPATMTMLRTQGRHEVLVQPFGYLQQVAVKLFETLEIAVWGTLLAILVGAPLAFFSARTLSPHPLLVFASRGVVSLMRAVPELISALFFVLAYGFGPIAGTLALALHGAGFLGKFYADDIENIDAGPQQALAAIGANRLKVLRHAILPQVLPQYLAYTLYVLDRNVRMATVIGLVGAGGIGHELKGRYDMYQYAHVGTILISIFLLVFALDQVSGRLRRRWI